ncbi:MAG: 2,3-bisphosphoglycerate-independent phosphoglycerate mutase [Proteobacteria bacterium]|nr:2,3-bisphosphoglycerate-independent phosphoglycerate mutase [Pseudomonadota bacterium]
MKKQPFHPPLLLCILDGFGLSDRTEGNAIKAANTPVLDGLLATCPHSKMMTHGPFVGLPEGQMGNSEVGHMNLGAGRVVLQNLERIQRDLDNGALAKSAPYKAALADLNKSRAIHMFGLLSDGGVHSHMDHAAALAAELDKLDKPVYIHAILDGRDTPPRDAKKQLPDFLKKIKGLKNVKIADVCGRFYAMDRDKRWDRTQAAYDMYTQGHAAFEGVDILAALASAHVRGEDDEFVQTTALPPLKDGGTVQNGDALFFFNFRADRMRQIVRTFIDAELTDMPRAMRPKLTTVITMTEYDSTFDGRVRVMFAPELHRNLLGEILAQEGKRQLRIAETEKYAHVTFFFNGGRDEPYNGEDRILVPSPKVRTYDLQPEMSLPELTDKLVAAIESKQYDFIVCNVANGDMVGHSGIMEAGIAAVEAIDTFLDKVLLAVKRAGGEAMITADHGNIEEMLDDKGGRSTQHSTNPVPFIYVGRTGAKVKDGRLADVAPTVLTLMGLPIPMDMDGSCLVSFS